MYAASRHTSGLAGQAWPGCARTPLAATANWDSALRGSGTVLTSNPLVLGWLWGSVPLPQDSSLTLQRILQKPSWPPALTAQGCVHRGSEIAGTDLVCLSP